MRDVDGRSGRGKGMLEVDEIMAILRSTVDRVRELTGDPSPAELVPVEYRDPEWSVTAVLAHLQACNDVLGGAMLRILREDHASWRAESPRTWQAKSGYHALAFGPLLDKFVAGRAELLAGLEGVSTAAWERTASVTVPPKTVAERSMRYYGDWLAQHERTHVRDLRRRATIRGTS